MKNPIIRFLSVIMVTCTMLFQSCATFDASKPETYAPAIQSAASVITVTMINKNQGDAEKLSEMATKALTVATTLESLLDGTVPAPAELKKAILAINPGADTSWVDYTVALTALYEGLYSQHATGLDTTRLAVLRNALSSVAKGIKAVIETTETE